ncbi:transglycosylase family protein [Streptomyces sp. H27-C3]|uniref:LysM peptidoglycan-binding domain-containing protein n=1 Tax=Streptomyces sp. H27-C3 TaxID=3046305 RepID=UPI0024B98936|nr:transglycosylase family protein [Streptomyces sp. H27-C3]MDJ0460447.1 transglycosylase family protein [Streptomyces sp. H27-C3]
MLSANGRHRRPRQAPALVVAAGVAGSAIAIPLLGASTAGAAEAATWDRVAECESAGMWSADLGNGYYGGLQFSQDTWKDFGGTEYAPRADLASRSQQIQIAEKVFADQGPQAWPSCSAISGLAKGDNAAPGDGATTAPTPSEAPDSTQADGPEGTEGSAEVPAKPEADDSAKSADTSESADPTEPLASEKPSQAPRTPAEKSATPTTEEGTPQGKHRGGKAEEPGATAEADAGNADESRESGESGRHASRGDGSARDAEGAATPDGEYVVRAGDSLWTIADSHDVSGGWSAIYEANETVVGSDADLIRPGQSLDLTAK